MTDLSHVARTEAQRERLKALVAGLSDEEFARPVGGGWTVSVQLAHIAFWDRLVLARLEKREREGTIGGTLDAHLINEAALAQWLALPGREAARQAVAAAEAVDRKVEELAPEVVDALLEGGSQRLVDRSRHRREHLDEIKQALAG